MGERFPLLKSTLAKALAVVGHPGDQPPPAEWFADIHHISGMYDWKAYVRRACFEIVGNARSMDDPYVDLICRAARNIKQADEILWDEPETDQQRAEEQPYSDALSRREAKRAELDDRMQKKIANQKTLILSDEEKAKLRDPTVPLIPNARLGSWAQNFSKHLIPTTKPFSWFDARVGWAGVDESAVMNRLIRAGIVNLIEAGTYASYAKVELGPRYLDYMSRWKLKADRVHGQIWSGLVHDLNAKWGTSHELDEWN